jgi:hypothetical protein
MEGRASGVKRKVGRGCKEHKDEDDSTLLYLSSCHPPSIAYHEFEVIISINSGADF